MDTCPLCQPALSTETIILENEFCLFLQRRESILIGSGFIVPRVHRVTVFDLSPEEWNATQDILNRAKKLIDEQHHPAGYNIGWNCSATAGQEIYHAHLHIIPRYKDEPLAGKGIRHWLKQEGNRRPTLPKFSS